MTQTDALQQAIALIRGGDKQQAQKLLEGIIKADPPNVQAWYWYAETFSDLPQRIRVLEACLRCNPGHPQVQKVLEALRIRLEAGRQPVAIPVQPPLEVREASHPPAWTNAEPPSFAANTVRRGKPSLNQQPVRPSMDGMVDRPALSSTTIRTITDEEILRKQRRARPFNLGQYITWSIIALLALAIPGVFIVAEMIKPVDAAPYRHTYPYEYYLYIPKAYTAEKAWPVFVGVHGAGGSGLDCWNAWQPYAESDGFILVCPSMGGTADYFYYEPAEQILFAVMNDVRSKYNTQPKVFIAGFSAGAIFVQRFAFRFPSYIQGAAVLSSGVYDKPQPVARNVPFVVVIGDADDFRAVENCRNWVDEMKQNGFTVRFEVLPLVGHQMSRQAQNLTLDLFRQVNNQ